MKTLPPRSRSVLLSKASSHSIARALFVAFGLLAPCTGCSHKPRDTSAENQAAIRALEDSWAAAVKAKDLNAVMAVYVSDPQLVVFDTTTPFQYIGTDAYRRDWQSFLATSQGRIDASVTQLKITAGNDVAYSSSIQHLSGTGANGKPFASTVRVTDGYKKINGRWLIAHEHVSLPMDPQTNRAVTDGE